MIKTDIFVLVFLKDAIKIIGFSFVKLKNINEDQYNGIKRWELLHYFFFVNWILQDLFLYLFIRDN